MKKNIFSFVMAAIAAVTIFASCEKNEINDKPSAVVTSDVLVDINVEGTYNNLIAVPSQGGKQYVVINTNVPCMSYAGEGYASGSGSSFEYSDGTFRVKGPGKIDYTFSYGKNDSYTVDCAYSMIQSLWEDTWTDYIPYGHLETDINFRIRGEKGERILDFNNPDNWDATNAYYLKGKILAISDITEGVKDFETLPLCKSIFERLNFQPSITSYTSQACVFTVATEKDTVGVQVFGKKRDKEISRLLENIKEGNNIEFPAVVKGKDKLKEMKLEPIKVSAVLKLD